METSEGFQQSRQEKRPLYKRYDPTDSIIRAIGVGLLIAFIFPVVVYVKEGFKYTIPNIEYFFNVLFGTFCNHIFHSLPRFS